MKEKKILFALKGLSVYELNSFSKFIHSPYFNVNKNISDYYDLLERHIKEGTVDDLSNETCWRIVFNNEPYHNQRFLKLNSDLLNLLEDFLAQQEYDQMTSLRACHKLAGAGKRNLVKLYNGILGDISRLDRSELNQSSEFYLNKYQIEKNIFSLKSENEKKNVKFEIDTELNIQNISENLDIFYIGEKLKQYCSLLSWKKMYKLEIQLHNIDSILEQSRQPPYSEFPAIKMYYTMVLTFVDEKMPKHFFNLKALINDYIHLFPEQEQKEIFYTAISYCVNKVNKGDFSFQEETFFIYKETIEKYNLLTGEIISPSDFRNIVFFALRVNEFEWTENFIQDYAEYLDPRYRDNAVEFSLARLEFYRKNFGKVLDHLNNVTFDDVWYTLGTKTLQVASYYELDEFDALESLLQSFKMYIKREKSLTKERKETYLNLIKYTSSLMKVNPRDQSKIQKIKIEIEQTKGIVSKPWLMEKVEEMIRK
ncbi:MAG: hypothetical protein KA341_10855 [Saprospiraceae bacterium]|jgi:hypothetical protein|nr:hypothetical protein [Saprospiraceae bacterium]